MLPIDLRDIPTKTVFDYAVTLDGISGAARRTHEGFLIRGHVTNLGDTPVAIGGNSLGCLNLGYRVLDGSNQAILFEDRVLLPLSHLPPKQKISFFSRLPYFDLSNALIQMDFVYEGIFWFKDMSSEKSYEISLGALQPFDEGLLERHSVLPASEAPRLRAAKSSQQKSQDMYASADQVQRYVFDLSDLIQYWADNIRPTGIQRVQIEVLREIILKNVDPELLTLPFMAISFRVGSHAWVQLPTDALLRQIELSSSPSVTKEQWLTKLESLVAASSPYLPKSGDALINLGSSWWIPDYLHKIQIMRHERGIRYIPFIHDTIPLTTPDYCAAGLVDEFRMWFRGAASIADHIVVNSRSSARDVARWSSELFGETCEISIAALNAAFVRPPSAVRSGILERLNLDVDRYVLCVGTLEARKNHAMLFQVWTELARRVPAAHMAKLILVGKEGWMFEAANALLTRNRSLREHVLVLSHLSDQELSEIYEHCMFTVYPSFYEGWGLPITEAISYGKLTVASNTSSIPEAASPGDILLDPSDYSGWYETIAKLIEDDEFRESATAISAERAELRGWADIANDILRAAKNSHRRPGGFKAQPIADGRIYDFKVNTARQNYDCSAYPFRSGAGWHHLEDWGVWSANGVTELKFQAVSEAARFLYLVIRGGPEASEITLSVDGKMRLRRQVPADERIILRLSLLSSQSKEHAVRIVVHNVVDLAVKTAGMDRRRIGIGFLNMMCIPEDNLAARVNFLESMQIHFV